MSLGGLPRVLEHGREAKLMPICREECDSALHPRDGCHVVSCEHRAGHACFMTVGVLRSHGPLHTSWILCVGSVATVFATVTAVVAALCAAMVAMRNDHGTADNRCCPASTLTSGSGHVRLLPDLRSRVVPELRPR